MTFLHFYIYFSILILLKFKNPISNYEEFSFMKMKKSFPNKLHGELKYFLRVLTDNYNNYTVQTVELA